MRSASSKGVFAWHVLFLQTLREAGSVVAAAKAAGISRKTAYWHRRVDSRFAARWDAAKDAFWKNRLDAAWVECLPRLSKILRRFGVTD
jgi:hypothetical protein